MIPERLKWKPISQHPKDFYDGARYLVAIEVSDNPDAKIFWEFHTIQASCDSESPLVFYKLIDGDEWEMWTDWDWEDCQYYIVIEDFRNRC